MGLRRHLVFSFTLFAAALLAATLIPFGVVSARQHLSAFVDARKAEAERVAAQLSPAAAMERIVEDRFRANGTTNAWLLTIDGVPAAPPTERGSFPSITERPAEVRSAARGAAASRIRTVDGEKRLFTAVPVIRDERATHVLWTSASLAAVQRLRSRTWATAAGIGAAALAAAALVGTALARRLTRRLEAVAAGADRFGEGRLREPIHVDGGDEIAAMAGRLNEMAAQIDDLIGRQKDFVAAASHQIRTPLTTIRIRLDEIRALETSEHPQVVEDLEEMTEEVDRLTVLASRLLDLSAAENARTPRRLPAEQAVQTAVDRVALLAGRRPVTLDVAPPPEGAVVLSPPGALEEVVFNLLENAVKYAPPHGRVRVRCEVRGSALEVEVADTGPGIPKEQRARVFEPFYRANHSAPGHGLGLAITARLCEAAAATLDLGSRPGWGTVARLRWPLARDGRGRWRRSRTPAASGIIDRSLPLNQT